ncbi:hypothetical protein bcgnr5378_04770 [Bacillus cereus]|uniref:Uncharacterized protein n=1 Tax=Bacillus cereus TaxID=1396 RepID=A0A161TPK4_BACCE|nr:hypothetical protein [Bacillus cereus]KZD55738.1 hypothetical protein B4088_5483 [Bacillus cereus]HDR8324063.1 hypothetical protein [Bacillus cereus]HDR8331002.1 hypothetical protein [Bacillus cereus]HDR8336583.1 hypothetical protein [Bacillus cereus]
MRESREELMRVMAEKYAYFLQTLRFDDEVYMGGMREARSKFLANLQIYIMNKQLPKKRKDWRYSSDYVSERALECLMKGKWDSKELQYDHMIPKSKYIKDVCEEAAMNGTATFDFIYEVLVKYFWVATIHKDENDHLTKLGLKSKMPSDWDGNDIFARYESAGIVLLENDRINMYN